LWRYTMDNACLIRACMEAPAHADSSTPQPQYEAAGM
jgi:hypothetical protein